MNFFLRFKYKVILRSFKLFLAAKQKQHKIKLNEVAVGRWHQGGVRANLKALPTPENFAVPSTFFGVNNARLQTGSCNLCHKYLVGQKNDHWLLCPL